MLEKAPEHFETARLLVRRPLPTDAQAIFHRYAGDAQVTQFLSWPTHRTVADTYAFVEWSDAEWARWPAGPYLIFNREKDYPRVLGSTGLVFKDGTTAEVGYALAQSAWGHGYATEVLLAVVEIAKRIGIVRLRAGCHAANFASARVLEKCGFLCEGIAPERTLFPNLAGGVRAEVLHYSIQFHAPGIVPSGAAD